MKSICKQMMLKLLLLTAWNGTLYHIRNVPIVGNGFIVVIMYTFNQNFWNSQCFLSSSNYALTSTCRASEVSCGRKAYSCKVYGNQMKKTLNFFRFGLRRGGFQVISISLKMLNCCALLTKVFGRHFCFSKRIIMSNLKLDKGNDSCSCFGVADGKFSAEIVMPYAPTLRAGFSFSRTPI